MTSSSWASLVEGMLHCGVRDVAWDAYVADFNPETLTASRVELLVDRLVGSNFGGALSPDGRYVTFLRRASNTVDFGAATLWVKVVGTGDERQLASVDWVGFADRVVQWFPDSRSVLLQNERQDHKVFQRMDVETGTVRTVFEGP